MIPLLNLFMTEIDNKLSEDKKKFLMDHKTSLIKSRLKGETEAIRVIKEKIARYIKTGNQRKLAIYQSKLNGKQPLIAQLNKLRKSYE